MGECLILCCQNIFRCVQHVELEVTIQETPNPVRCSSAARFFSNLLFSEALNQFVKDLRERCLQLSLHVGGRGELCKKRVWNRPSCTVPVYQSDWPCPRRSQDRFIRNICGPLSLLTPCRLAAVTSCVTKRIKQSLGSDSSRDGANESLHETFRILQLFSASGATPSSSGLS